MPTPFRTRLFSAIVVAGAAVSPAGCERSVLPAVGPDAAVAADATPLDDLSPAPTCWPANDQRDGAPQGAIVCDGGACFCVQYSMGYCFPCYI